MILKDEEDAEDDDEKIDPHLMQYPEKVEFTGVSESSLKSVHITSALVVAAGVLIAINTYPAGLLLLIAFLVIVFAFEAWMGKKSMKVLKIELYLRQDPVKAVEGRYMIGEIATGAINNAMENPNELGYRPSPKHRLKVWTFESKNDADVVAKRLLEYLPRDTQTG